MKENKEPIRPITWVIVGIAVVFIIGSFGFQLYQSFQQQKVESEKRIKEQQDLILEQQKALEQTKKEIGDMTETQKIIQKKTDESQKTAEEAQRKLQEENNKPTLPSVIAQWRSRIAYIECDFRYSDTGRLYATQAGSGLVAMWGDGDITVLTNKHVVLNKGIYGPNECRVILSGGNKTYTAINTYPNSNNPIFGSDTNTDWGVINIISPDSYLRNLTSSDFSRCIGKASIGDEIVILGYPGIGSQTDITATRGIISGYDGDYYITDAKIEHGNSGGAAILLKDNCYLGIPTYVIVGEVESLARILDSNVIWNLWDNSY